MSQQRPGHANLQKGIPLDHSEEISIDDIMLVEAPRSFEKDQQDRGVSSGQTTRHFLHGLRWLPWQQPIPAARVIVPSRRLVPLRTDLGAAHGLFEQAGLSARPCHEAQPRMHL